MRRDDDIRQPDDRGTVLESIDALQAECVGQRDLLSSEARPATRREPVPVGAALGDIEEFFRPAFRPPVPRLILLDDGTGDSGETIRLRDQVVSIGRTEGTVRLPHDPLVSSKHAEIIREGNAAPFKWVLKDNGSANGTFVRSSKSLLRPDRILILGSRRFRFRASAAVPQSAHAPQHAGTVAVDTRGIGVTSWPALIESLNTSSPLELQLKKEVLSVGRPGAGNDIELDDPCIAKHHAQISRNSAGEWHIEATPSKNGVWVQINAIRLTSTCRFQCGEQRFLFSI